MATQKIDLTKTCKRYYTASSNAELITIEPANFLSICGKGDPAGQEFLAKVQALYATAYTLKFACKSNDKDFVVAKLEAQWWFDTSKFQHHKLADVPIDIPRSEWEYRLLIRMPAFVSQQAVTNAIKAVAIKKELPLVHDISLYHMREGLCVQILHMGPFHDEPSTLQRLQQFMQSNGLQQNGLHHEIYLSDFRKTAPEKLRTILREPVK